MIKDMKFEENSFIKKFGEKIGYLFGYFLFTTILFFVLSFSSNNEINYFSVVLITIVITGLGMILKRALR